jgi:hypothetical protein
LGDEEINTDNWLYRKPITVNSSQISGDLIDFPILINIKDFDLQTKARFDGFDIVFTQSNGRTRLDHEIERYNSIEGELIAWVKIPYLTSSVDTKLYMYYGYPNAPNHQNVEGVWSNGYVGVYHMPEETGSINNSASDNNDGLRENTPTRTSGQVGYGQEFTGSGAQDYFNLGDLGIADGINENITFSTWANINDSALEDDAKIFCKRISTDDDNSYTFTFDNDGVDKDIEIELNGLSGDLQEVPKSTWVYLVGTYNGSNMIFYINSINVDQNARSGALWASSKNVTIGVRKRDGLPADHNYGGILDEMRFSDVARSGDWITTEFNNQNSSETFYTIGNEEVVGSPTNYEWVELYNADNVPVDLTGWKLSDNDGNTFNLSGAGTIPVGGYLVCHLGQMGTNSSKDVYGPIINGISPQNFMLEDIDDLALLNSTGDIIDYVAWGGDPGDDDSSAMATGIWQDGEFVDTTGLLENETIGRDMYSTDTDTPDDWENSSTSRADPFGINSTRETPGATNLYPCIPEYEIMAIPIMALIIIVFYINKNHIYYNSIQHHKRSKKLRKNRTKNRFEKPHKKGI